MTHNTIPSITIENTPKAYEALSAFIKDAKEASHYTKMLAQSTIKGEERELDDVEMLEANLSVVSRALDSAYGLLELMENLDLSQVGSVA